MQTQVSMIFFSPVNDASVTFDTFNSVEVRSRKLTLPVDLERDGSAGILPDSASCGYEKLFTNMMKLAEQTFIF